MSSSSGSEKRQRQIKHTVRLNDDEYIALKKKADGMGISLAKLMRDVPLGRKFRSRERKKTIADLGRLGGLFKLAITQDHLAAYRSEFKELIELLKVTIEKVSQEDDFETHTP